MRSHQFAGDGETEPATAGPCRAKKRAEQIVPRLWRQPRAVIHDLDRNNSVLARRGTAQPVCPGFDRIAREIQQHAIELVAIGLDRELGRDRAVDRQAVAGRAETRADFVDQRSDGKPARTGPTSSRQFSAAATQA